MSARRHGRTLTYPRPRAPRHLALIGAAGTGKTTLARQLVGHGFTHLSIDVLRQDGGDWEQLVAILTRSTAPLVIESVGAPVIYRRALPAAHALLVHVHCTEAVRLSRIRDRPTHLQGSFQPLVTPHVKVDTTRPVEAARIARLAGLIQGAHA